jgi:hypothetical protein
MTGSTALLLLTLTRGLSGETTENAPLALSLQGEAAQPSPWTLDLTLDGGAFIGQRHRRAGSHSASSTSSGGGAAELPVAPAQPATGAPPAAVTQPAPAAPPAAAVQPAPAAPPAAAAQPAPAAEPEASAQCDVDCEDAREGQRLGRYVMRNRERTLRTHRGFAIAAWSTMLVTEALGTIQMVNQDTWFGRGNCASDPRSFACEQTSLVQSLHETFAFITTGLYTTAGVLAVAAPDPDHAAEGNGGAESRLRLHKTLAYVHGAGMILLPILGILSANPQVFGINDNNARADFSRATRTIHGLLGFATFATFTVAGALEF